MFRCITLICILSWLALNSFAQNDSLLFNGKKHKVGLSLGYGNVDLAGLKMGVDYHYQVYFFQFEYKYAILRKSNWGVDFLAYPQHNITRLKLRNNDSLTVRGYEFGLNMGFLIRRNFLEDRLSVYASITSGPHYVSDAPARQIPGFIFSDCFNAGINARLSKQLYGDFRPGFRHISNAELRFPNGGVNSFTINIGLFYVM